MDMGQGVKYAHQNTAWHDMRVIIVFRVERVKRSAQYGEKVMVKLVKYSTRWGELHFLFVLSINHMAQQQIATTVAE